MLKYYSQRDPKWGAQFLGNTKYTVERWGCTVTCLAMGSTYFAGLGAGNVETPSTLARKLSFTPLGYLLWGSLLKTTRMKLSERIQGRNDAKIRAALKNPKTICLLEVEGRHWVLATGKVDEKTYKIADPLFGDKSTTLRYKNRITGAAVVVLN